MPSATLILYGQFTASKVGKTGLAATVTVKKIAKSGGTVSTVAAAGTRVTGELFNGIYYYTVTSADLTAYDYIAAFSTTDGTVDQKDVPAAFAQYGVQADVAAWAGTALGTPAAAGIPDVNVKNINDAVAATPGAAGGLLIAGSNAATTFATFTVMGACSLNGTAVHWNYLDGFLLNYAEDGFFDCDLAGNVRGKVLGGGTATITGDGVQAKPGTGAATSANQTSISNAINALPSAATIATAVAAAILVTPANKIGTDGSNNVQVDKTGYALSTAGANAVAAAVEAAILNEADGEAVLQAIVDKINSVDTDLSGLSIAAIASAVQTAIERAGGMLALTKSKTDLIATNDADSGNAQTAQTQMAAIAGKMPAGAVAGAADVPTAAQNAAAIDDQLSNTHGSGAWGGSGGAGDGNIPVNHNTGGTDALRVVAGGVGIEGCTIRAYIKADYDAGLRVVKAEAATGDDGRWIEDMMLSAGTYTLTFSAPGYVLADQEVTIVS
jgi:hypothetical protein